MIQAPIARLHELFRLDRETGYLYRLADVNQHRAGGRAGTLMQNGYRCVQVDGKKIMEHRVVFAMIHGRWPALHIDHANGVTDDNRPCNIREATHAQNMANSKLPCDSTTGLKGVCFDKSRGKFMASISINGRFKNLGRFDTAEEAHAAYMRAAQQIHGQFARAA